MFKDIRISVSDRFPATSWTNLGEFKAENVRKLQTFKIENPLIWAKYLKVEVLSYFGDEFYCPLSSVQVHGKTMLEQFKEENPDDLIDEINDELDEDEVVESTCVSDGEKSTTCEAASDEDMKFSNPPDFETFLKETIALIDTETGLDNESSIDNDCLVSPYLGLSQFLEDYKKNMDEDLCTPVISYDSKQPKTKTATAQTQDSIYKNIVKRISLLESNATLSLLYIEEQSKLLSTAFDGLEARQNTRFSNLLLHLNATVQMQMDRLRVLGDDLSSNFEHILSMQNKKFENMLVSSNQKMETFEHDLNFQKKINYLTLLTVILLLLYIIVTRDTYIESEFINPTFQVQNLDNGSVVNMTTASPVMAATTPMSSPPDYRADGSSSYFPNYETAQSPASGTPSIRLKSPTPVPTQPVVETSTPQEVSPKE
ncbi:unnamed protein product [Ambrosiozyma monospora]|uniref:Unnamed protein product n=1 Tax=Ambrosiozyma monospora TaxID=43982 RepID=A0ACB5TNG0_AMBMO|nr:unnamed protein product [Ambrosiozyma monospora]